MKTLSLIALMTLTTFNAFAGLGNDGPSATPKPKVPAIVAEVVVACGFCPKPGAQGVRIYDNGLVASFASTRGEKEKLTTLAQLEESATRKLIELAESMPSEELIDQQEGQPMCMDAPTTTYLVHRINGTRQKLEQQVNCHTHTLQYNQGKSIVGLLEGFLNISR